MTPAIRLLERHATPHEVLQYPHDPKNSAYGEEAAHRITRCSAWPVASGSSR